MIGLVIGIAGASLFGWAGRECVKDQKREMEDIESETQKMIAETEELVEETNSNMQAAYEELIKQRKRIITYTFKKATKITEKIKITTKVNLKNEMVAYEGSVNELKVEKVCFTGYSVAGVVTGPIIGPMVEWIMLDYKKDELLANKEKVRAECSKAKYKCTRMRNATQIIYDSISIVDTLNELTNKSINNVSKILEEKGYDSVGWDKHDVDAIRTMFNFLKAESDIMNVEVFTKGGNITDKYKKMMGETKVFLAEAE